MQDINHINQAINNNKRIYQEMSSLNTSSNKATLKKSCEIDSFEKAVKVESEEEQKNKKTRKILLSVCVAATAISAVMYAITGKKFNVDLNMEKFKDIKIPGVDKTAVETFRHKFANSLVNFTNLKDDAWDRFATFLHDKTPLKFIKEGGDKFSNWYRGNVRKSVKKQFENCQGAIALHAQRENIHIDLKRYDDLFDELDTNIGQRAKADRITTKANLFGGKTRNARNLFETLTSPIADNKLSDIVAKHADFIEVPKGASKELEAAIQKYNRLQQTTLIPKLRDINYGCAPTDVITAGIPMLGFGAAMATCDKEERKDLLFNLGIPLLPALFMPIVGTFMPILNGFKGMASGLVVGQVVSNSVKIADAKIKEKQQQIQA